MEQKYEWWEIKYYSFGVGIFLTGDCTSPFGVGIFNDRVHLIIYSQFIILLKQELNFFAMKFINLPLASWNTSTLLDDIFEVYSAH